MAFKFHDKAPVNKFSKVNFFFFFLAYTFAIESDTDSGFLCTITIFVLGMLIFCLNKFQ